jgi:two-component system cell cycle sensor histidine kinase/response regulator CckA
MSSFSSESEPKGTLPSGQTRAPATSAGRYRILQVEDSPYDAELIQHGLRKGGLDFDIAVVDSLPECERLLDGNRYDAIICDYNLPQTDGLEVLAFVRMRDPHIPFILVSGSLGEEKAIEALKQGATDYLLKDRLSRIPVAVLRGIEEARSRARARAVEAQLIQSQKMEAIGRLAGGVAHDFNNMLTVINGYSELLLGQMSADDSKRRDLEEILNAGRRAAGLTRQLLAFSRRQILQPTAVRLNELLEGLERMLSRLIGEDVKLQLRLAHNLHLVKADAGQIEQVIANLVVNARDAMPKGGKIVVETLNVDLDEAFVSVHPDLHPGPYVLLMVSDTGCGMTAEVKEHLFEPFFTTKERGKGTGLGLSTALGIVQQCHGAIQVSSEIGWGTTFRIYLPRTELTDAPKAAPPSAILQRRGRETLLVVEDMETVRRLTRAVLEAEGYTVLAAEDGPGALLIAQGHSGEIHLLLSDIVMPKMNGPELAATLRPRLPNLKVIYMSGYTDRCPDELKQVDAGVLLLQKPFTVAELRKRVREVLDSGVRRP